MSPHPVLAMRRADYAAAIAAIVILSVANAYAQPTPSADGPPIGRINFDVASGLQPAVELDLTAGTFDVMFGLSDAAIVGVAESLAQSPDGGQGAEMVAQQLAATRQMIDLVKEVVHEVRVRVYDGTTPEVAQTLDIGSQFEDQLRTNNWNTVLRANDKNNKVRISLLEQESAVRGVFIVAMDGRNTVLINAVCDVSPENVKKITSAATKIGMESGLSQMIEAKMRELQPPTTHVAPPTPPNPPAQ